MRVEVTTRIEQAGRRAKRGAERGVAKGAEYMLGESRRFVPLEEGALERSGRVEASGLKAEVGYGGTDQRTRIVAIVQHERLNFRHAPGRTAKYLERVVTASGDVVLRIIAAEVRRELRG